MIWNDRIKERREALGMTLQDVSKKLGLSESTAQRYESKHGIKNIPYDTIVAYSKILHVTPSYLMGWETEDDYVIEQEQKADTDEAITNSERLLLKYYRSITEEKQNALLQFLGIEEDQK